MPTSSASLISNSNRVTAKFALYFSLDDKNRHTDAPDLLSLITDLGLLAAAVDILSIVGHHLVERATDFVLDHAIDGAKAFKSKLMSLLRSEKAAQSSKALQLSQISVEAAHHLDLMTEALQRSTSSEVTNALRAGELAIATLVRIELNMPEAKAREYSIAITQEIKTTVRKQ
jgi:hypothetical protein